MLRSLTVNLFFYCLLFVPNVADSQEELPFWKQKKGLYEQVIKQRRVIVSVKEESVGEQKKFRMMGVGAVNAPLGFSAKQIMMFEKLPEVSSYFKKIIHKKDKRQIYIVLEALGYQARMLLEYKWQDKGAQSKQMDWRVVWGPFKGMVGHYHLFEVNPGLTEISMWASFTNPQLPIPQFLMKFTLEVIAEKVAQKMRSYIEVEYRNIKK